MKKQLVDHMDKNSLFSASQHGFRGQHSTTTAVRQLVAGVLESFEAKKSTALILADLSKAFDCVSHSILLGKLELYGVTGQPLQMFHSYLEGRKQVFSVNGASSTPLPVVHGVPQGSVLGPLLFLVLINDLELVGDVLLFADDSTFFTSGDTPEDARAQALQVYDRAKEWFSANKLSLNLSKTQELTCTLSPNHIQGSVKLLGFTLDSKLTWNGHVTELCRKLSRVTCLLRRLRPLLTEKHLVTIYHGLFHSHILYGLLLWGHSSGCDEILLLQKHAVRIITSAGFLDHCKPLFSRLKILTVFSQYVVASLLHVRGNLSTLGTRGEVQDAYRLRNGSEVNRVFCRLSKTRDCFPTLAIKLYNCLPQHLKALECVDFDSRIRNWFLANPLYSVKDFIDNASNIA
uniref:Reverse transcriptase domain-containing protein n=1 Tax=Graphocephala atropunctata TaxID=36148 RepID=A0A1B6KML7_9HEMI